jgi:hypothetical protein
MQRKKGVGVWYDLWLGFYREGVRGTRSYGQRALWALRVRGKREGERWEGVTGRGSERDGWQGRGNSEWAAHVTAHVTRQLLKDCPPTTTKASLDCAAYPEPV